MKHSRLIAIGALVSFALIGTITPEMASAQQSAAEPIDQELVKSYVSLDRPVSLVDAASLGESAGLNVVGFRYQSPGLVGEYYKTLDQSAFLSGFTTKYGTSPEVVSLIVATPSDKGAGFSSNATKSPLAVPTSYPTFTAAASLTGTARHRIRSARVQAKLAPHSAKASNVTTTAASNYTYQPQYAQYGTYNYSGKAEIWQYFNWTGQASPLNRDPSFGLEFKVFQQNNNATGTRPICFDTATHSQVNTPHTWFWAQDQAFSWTLYYTNNQSTAALGAYADTNDAFDACNTETMGVGIRYPGLLSSDGLYYDVAIDILANHGVPSSSLIGAYIHQVEGTSCNGFPWNGSISTDCMGLNQNIQPTAGLDNSGSHTMLNISRNYHAPNACWETYLTAQQLANGSYDTVSPYACPEL